MLKLIALNYTVMLNGYVQWLNIRGKKQFPRDISSTGISPEPLKGNGGGKKWGWVEKNRKKKKFAFPHKTFAFPIKSYSMCCISITLMRTFFVRPVVKHVCQTRQELA